ncbi:MAG: molybdopterin-dependent oxidoreductase [Eubacteriales bacterium]|nr:molybdopterin-dependent oxidoreductase [Eubacteriales bacterium]
MRRPDSLEPGKYVGQSIVKKDAKALVTGKPVYCDDLAPDDCLIIKILRSPHAHAMIRSIDTSKAKLVPGVECVLTYKDVPQHRFTQAGQTYLEASPYDRYILDQHIRCVGDEVAIVAADTEKAALKALKLIKVEYDILPAILDYREALDNEIIIHPEEDWSESDWSHGDNKRNCIYSEEMAVGDVDEIFKECDEVIEESYHTIQNQQSMMETFQTYCYMDTYGRLVIVSSTQVPFHVRRDMANALGIPKSKIRVIKPRIGGGFGAKQTAVCERFPAVVTWLTGKPSKIIYTREETMVIGSARHEMSVDVKLGAMKDGTIRAIEMNVLSNTGAYGEHGPTTIGLAGHKSIPLYGGKFEACRFIAHTVYSNQPSAGAFRGYGAPQGIFALESTVNLMAARLGIDPVTIREKNMLHEGELMPAYFNETANACALDQCMERCKEMIGWDEKYPSKVMPDGHIRSVGVAMAMQGSCISFVDEANVTIKINDDGFYSLLVGSTDMGTGSDTILAQMAADILECDVDDIVTFGVDTDTSPYDSGSYASSTTYLTGNAVVKACQKLRSNLIDRAAKDLECAKEEIEFDGKTFTSVKDGKEITLKDIANNMQGGLSGWQSVTEGGGSPVSPPPYMVGMVEIDLDPMTGKVIPLNYATCVDCGTVVNPNLATVQTEGGIMQGVGMALYENQSYNEKGNNRLRNFMQYKIPTRLDIPEISVDFRASYEPTGPFGAKSIGEIVINTPPPAIADAIFNATGVMLHELPMTPERVWRAMQEKKD